AGDQQRAVQRHQKQKELDPALHLAAARWSPLRTGRPTAGTQPESSISAFLQSRVRYILASYG
ncbi:MAG: hypothetical protein WAU59_04480, partial [Rhodoplanes sp.]